MQPSEPMQPQDNPNQPAADGSAPDSTPSIDVAQSVQPTDDAAQHIATSDPQPTSANTGLKRIKKRYSVAMLAGIAGVVVLLGGSAGAYFGVYAPNQPENVWKTAMNRTGRGLQGLSKSAASQNQSAKSNSLSGSFKVDSADFKTDGSYEYAYDEKNANLKLDVGAVTSRITVEAKIVDSPNSESPDVYFKGTGLKGFDSILGSEYGSMLNQIDGQWYVIDHTLIDNLAGDATGSSQGSDITLTQEELAKIYTLFGQVSKEYLFTTNESKAVPKVVKSLGKETQDGRSVHHFVVGLDKQHTKDYVNALVDAMDTTAINKLLSGKKIRDATDVVGLLSSIDRLKESDTIDVYVDAKTKLVRTIRIYDESDKDKKTYIDLGLHYTGGDDYPFVMQLYDNGSLLLNAKATLNNKNNTLKGDIHYELPASAAMDKITVDVTFASASSQNELKVEKPSSAKSVNELLSGLDGLGGSSVSPTSTLPSDSLFDLDSFSPDLQAL